MFVRATSICIYAVLAAVLTTTPAPASAPSPFLALTHEVRTLARHVPAAIALDVVDINTGDGAGFNAAKSMPAASTIKLPVMVTVFDQLASGRFDLSHRVTLLAQDKDYGSGDLCDEPAGSTYSISDLLDKMIDVSDNTATNMLIREVGRRAINVEMRDLGLSATHLSEDVRTDAWSIRAALRTSPADLVHLLTLMARGELVDQWSSNEMIAILEADQINTLLPQPLPANVPIAHKTGSFSDTMNDAGIVFASNAPYAIAVMTTALPSQQLGRLFIRRISRLAYNDEIRFARWRSTYLGAASPDVPYWTETTP